MSEKKEECKAAEYLTALIEPLLAFPEDLRIDVKNDNDGQLLLLEVNPQDMGRVVGRQGATANAFRRLVRQYGLSRDVFVSTKIVEPNAQDENTEEAAE